MSEKKQSPMVKMSEKAIGESLDFFKTRFDYYRDQREDIDERYELADWMYKSGTSRATYDVERQKFIARVPEGKACVGSMLFHRQVNQLAAALADVFMSGRELVQYKDLPVKGSPESGETGAATGDQMTALAKWIMKADDMDMKWPEFSTSVFKQSNIFALMTMKYEEKTVYIPEIQMEETGEVDENQQPIYKQKTVLRRKKGETCQIPSVRFPYPRSIYADKYMPNIKEQDCVIILTRTTKEKLKSEGKWLDQEAVNTINQDDHGWDGTYGKEGMESDAEHLHRDDMGETKGIYLRWDVYARLPVMKGEWIDEDAEEQETDLYWCVFVGNELSDKAVCLKAVTGFAPDGEIPIKEVRAVPDEPDVLYHTTLAEVIRSAYAADCGLMNSALDNNAIVNDPPLSVIRGLAPVKDLTFKSGQKWIVDSHEAIKQWEVRDSTMNTVQLRQQVRDEVKQALATDDPQVGEYAGARTSATEFMGVAGNTEKPLRIRNGYIIQQILPWLGRKYLAYSRAYMDPEQIRRILNEHMSTPIAEPPVLGEYDVVVDVITQYEDDRQLEMKLDRLMQIVAANPQLLQSEQHEIDLGELMKQYLEHSKLPASLVKPRTQADSEGMARQRIQTMLHTGDYQPPMDGENHGVHLRIARGERLRWRGLEDSADPRALNVPLLDQYIEELKFKLEGGGGQQQPQGMIAEQTPGQEVGNEQAASLGALMGGL